MSWQDRALEAALRVGAQFPEFSADDVLDRVGPPDDAHVANGANNGIGAVFNTLARRGLIEPTGRTVKSRQPHRKGGRQQTWRLIQPVLWEPT